MRSMPDNLTIMSSFKVSASSLSALSAVSVIHDSNVSSLPLRCLVTDEQNTHLAANTPVLLVLSRSCAEVERRSCLLEDVDGVETTEGVAIAVKSL